MTVIYEPELGTGRRTWTWAIPVLAIVLTFGSQVLVLVPLDLSGIINVDNIEAYPQILYLIVGSFAVAFVVFALWITLFEKQSLGSVGLGLTPLATRDYLFGLGLGLLMAVAVVFSIGLLHGYVVESDVSPSGPDLAPIVILLVAFMIQAGTEEFIFRGWMLARIASRYGIWAGILGNSIVFTLMHVDPEGLTDVATIAFFVIGTMLFGVFLSLLAVRDGSIWSACAWHASWNWMFITCFGLPTTGIELHLVPLISDLMPAEGASDWLTGGADGPEGSILMPVILTIGVAWLLTTKRRHLPAT